MGFDVKQAYEEIERTTRRTLKEDLKIILGFFGFKVKEKSNV